MAEIVGTVTGKGRITLPAHVRRHLGGANHQTVAFFLEESGSVRLQALKYSTIADLSGAAGTLPSPLSWEEPRASAREAQAAAASIPNRPLPRLLRTSYVDS
ncbi:MAG: AbrB/MazE/SpoVT family DNA-binding domain-containing protein [Chloroflexota bacterium]|nr:AbrB/MazE/SpoVT family DNA-binding domain-containing protein [Chloroflexota bacterium]